MKTVKDAKAIAGEYVRQVELEGALTFGLPEIDDRYHIWRVPLRAKSRTVVGEVVIDAISTLIDKRKTTTRKNLEKRLLGRVEKKSSARKRRQPSMSTLRNTVGLGDSEELLNEMPAESVDLVFTSPPYYNARPEYSDFVTYEEYLLKMRKVLQQAERVLHEGRFFVLNVSHVLLRRASRSESSKRIAVPFDFHRLFVEEGFDFVDDIIWVKPEGAGWATGRGRRFAADRNPLQYKAVPVTEYVLVYRKRTDRLIDWHIRRHPDQGLVQSSKIGDDYEKTNLWKIHPAHSKKHPAIFPVELASKVICYYSFKNDVVLDPFAGIGTTGEAAASNSRRFVLFEINPDYVAEIDRRSQTWPNEGSREINWLNYKPSSGTQGRLPLVSQR